LRRFGRGLRHARYRRQYSIRSAFKGTVMRHFFLLLALPLSLPMSVASLAQGMHTVTLGAVLIALDGCALELAAPHRAASLAAVALAAVAPAANQDLAVAVAARTDEAPCAEHVARRPGG
jgi:hypothetical protein